MGSVDLVALLRDLTRVPPLPGAACRGHAELFDAALVNVKITAALRICAECPVIEPCRRWASSLPARDRVGVFAGVHTPIRRKAIHMAELIPFNLGGTLRFTAKRAAIIPTPSGDGRIIPRLLVVTDTDDPAARHIVMDLDRPALAGIIRTAELIEKASATGQSNDIAAQLGLRIAMDEIDDIDE